MNVTNNLLNNVVAMNTWRTIRNSSAPAPTWALWLTAGLLVITIVVTAVLLWNLWKDDIEYYFWSKQYEKK